MWLRAEPHHGTFSAKERHLGLVPGLDGTTKRTDHTASENKKSLLYQNSASWSCYPNHCLTPTPHVETTLVVVPNATSLHWAYGTPYSLTAEGDRSLMWPYHITGTPGCSTPLCSVPLHCTQGR